jgi:hypothetical protein
MRRRAKAETRAVRDAKALERWLQAGAALRYRAPDIFALQTMALEKLVTLLSPEIEVDGTR